jgi:hypothetical protein
MAAVVMATAPVSSVASFVTFMTMSPRTAGPGASSPASGKAIGESIYAFAQQSSEHLPDVPDPLERVNIACRLWAGCLKRGEGDRRKDQQRPNDAETRGHAWPIVVSASVDDPIFVAGVEAAPWFHRLRGDSYYFDGLPSDAAVRPFDPAGPM